MLPEKLYFLFDVVDQVELMKMMQSFKGWVGLIFEKKWQKQTIYNFLCYQNHTDAVMLCIGHLS